jgi:hypothetical protein
MTRDQVFNALSAASIVGVQAAMTPRPGKPRLDLFKCDTCRFDVDVRH